jgi:hypothetical protein
MLIKAKLRAVGLSRLLDRPSEEPLARAFRTSMILFTLSWATFIAMQLKAQREAGYLSSFREGSDQRDGQDP